VIIGGGIAAHTAALYTARASLNPVVISGKEPDQLSLTTLVENFPGFPEGVMGPELAKNARKQAEKFGAKYIEELAESFNKKGSNYVIKADGKTYEARTVVISTGAKARTLGIPGESKYFGRGVSTCAICDAALYRDKIVMVAGGGDSAMEESLALYKFAKKVYIVHRRDAFRASKIMQDRVLKLKDKIEVIWNSVPVEVTGDKFVTGVKIKNVNTNKETLIKCDGMFLAIGHVPNTEIFKGKVELDEQGFVKTERNMHTNLPGVFAAGDVQDHVYKQAATSAGTGCMAAIEAERYIENLKATGKY
ncbi:MAG: thioredoxin-disulfide reductase, partial [Nanoarchaeota archaeon]